MTEAKPVQKKYASAGNPSINAILKGLYRFANEQQALDRLHQLREHFVVSKKDTAPDTVVLWIRGYEVSPTETEKGFTGNYASVTGKKKGEKFTLKATKLETELNTHPQRKRPARRHPDWGHPILRDIKKKRAYPTIEAAARELHRLHEEFPEVSIPDDTRLMIILYEKQEGVKSPVQKYKFEIKSVPDVGFVIDYKQNIKSKKPVSKNPDKSEKPADQTSQGHFTSMVILKRRKKKPAPKPSA